MRKEYWLPVVGYEGLYEVSNWGRIASLNYNHTGKRHLLNPAPDRYGYVRVCLSKNGKYYMKRVHRLVWETFNGEIPEGLQVNHIDENKENNCLWNLNLMTPKDNSNWGSRTERSAKNNINHPAKSKAVITKDPITLKVVYEFPSVSEAERSGFKHSAVSAACRGCYMRDGNHRFKDLLWFYA